MAEPLKPPFAYFGAKVTIAERIASMLPPHEHYIEPFAGSLAVLLAKSPSAHETVNDLDQDLMVFWRVLRERPAELERACALTPHSRAEYAAARKPADDELERARRVWVLLAQGRSGTLRKSGWRYYVSPGGSSTPMPGYLAGYVERLAGAAERLARVSLECRPALDIVRAYGAERGCLLYVDPPYLGTTRSVGYYQHEMPGAGEHRELLETLLSCRAAVVLSGYASELYDGLLSAWFRREILASTGNGQSARARTEVLWSNRPWSQGSLFDLEAS